MPQNSIGSRQLPTPFLRWCSPVVVLVRAGAGTGIDIAIGYVAGVGIGTTGLVGAGRGEGKNGQGFHLNRITLQLVCWLGGRLGGSLIG